jgi:DNA-binding NarL/FixJ family response regulator
MIKILLVDCQQIFREGLKSFLNRKNNIIIVGEAESGEEAIRKVFDLTPDIIIMDAKLNTCNGLDISSIILKREPATKIIILSNNIENIFIIKALEYGIKAYLSKNASSRELLYCIQKVNKGEIYYPDDLLKEIEYNIIDKVDRQNKLMSWSLSFTELEVLRLLSKGKIIKEIAESLNTSIRTTNRKIRNIKKKLNQNRKTDLIDSYNQIIIKK